jgi:predicted kinase
MQKELYIPKHGLQIDRHHLPQIKSTDVPDFLHWLKVHKHSSVVHTELPIAALYPTQSNFNHSKIHALMGQEKVHLKKPIIVSGDHYVIDGHHRWLALLNMDNQETIPVYLVHMKALDVIAAMKEYPKSFTKNVLDESFSLLMEGVHDAGIFKAVFVAGGPGSGKDFVLKKSLDGHGLSEINSDTAFEYLMDKNKLDKKMPETEQEKRDVVRNRAKSMTELRQRLALQGRNGLIINSTGANTKKLAKMKEMLEDLGYDTKMVFVDTSDNVSRARNVERGQRGGRMVPEKLRLEKWREAQDARHEFAKLFGTEHYHEFNNDVDLRSNLDPEIHTQKSKELMDLYKTVKKFTQAPPKQPQAQEWIHRNLGQLAKKPIGNKVQQQKVAPPPQTSQAAEEARKLGLQYFGFGRYGKNGRVTHFSVHDRLVEKQKALTPPKTEKPVQKVAESLDHAFAALLTEGEPVRDTGEEGGPVLGMDKNAGEELDLGRGGKSTSGPKKTLRTLRGGLKS